jgi:hypothetical protein
VVVKYHRSVSTVLSELLAAGLTLTGLAEPSPSDEVIAGKPWLAPHRRRPPLLVISAVSSPAGCR